MRRRRIWLLGGAAGALLVTWLGHFLLLERLEGIDDPATAVHLLRIATALLTSAALGFLVVGWWPARQWVLEVEGPRDEAAPVGSGFSSNLRQRSFARWFVRARWVAVALSFGLIGLSGSDNRTLLLAWWGMLVVVNLIFGRVVESADPQRLLAVQVAADLVVLTGFLNAAGGLENPAFSFYLFHILIAHVLLSRRLAFALTAVAISLFLLLAVGEYVHLLPHYTNLFFPHELVEPGGDIPAPDGDHRHADAANHASHDLFFVLGRTIPFVAVMLLAALLTATVMRSLRRRERALERAAEEATLEHERLEGVVQSSGVGMMQLMPGIRIDWASSRASEWLDAGPLEVGSRCPLHRSGECAPCVVAESFENGRPARAQREARLSEGRRRFYRHSSSPVHDSEGRVVQVVEVIEDVTNEKALEEEAIRAGKLSVLGRMAAGIAHEIGNPLSSLSTRLSLVERRPEPAFVRESVEILRAQIARISRIVHGVSHFARRGGARRQEWDVEALVAETLSIVELDRRCRGVRFERIGRDQAVVVFAVRDHVVQILLNLLLNAAEVAPEGTAVHLECQRDGDWVRISVADRGPGLSPEARQHLFEPFFTTKEGGTGLGLSISAGLADSQGGRIEVESAEGSGARFTLVLPISTREHGPARPRTDRPEPGIAAT